MLNPMYKIMLTATAIAPVGLVFAWIEFQSNSYYVMTIYILVTILLFGICAKIIQSAQKTLEKLNFSIETIEAADRESIGFLLLYILPLFTATLDKLNWQIWIPIVLIFSIIVGTGYSYHFNPLLNLLGWHFYKVTTPEGVVYVLLTKKELRNTKKQFQVVQLTEYIVLDVEKK